MIVCSECGTENDDYRNVCTNCGAFIGKNKVIRESDPEVLKKKRRQKNLNTVKAYAKSIGLMLLALLGFGLIMFLFAYLMVKYIDWPTDDELASEASAYYASQNSEQSKQTEKQTEAENSQEISTSKTESNAETKASETTPSTISFELPQNN